MSVGADSTLEITLDGHHARYHLRRSLRSPRPAEVSAVAVPSLLQVPRVSTRVAAALASLGWSFATTVGAALLRLPDGYTWETESSNRPETVDACSRWSCGMSRVVYAILSSAHQTSPTQTALAKLAGVTQARVSTIVRDLARAGLVSTERGRVAGPHFSGGRSTPGAVEPGVSGRHGPCAGGRPLANPRRAGTSMRLTWPSTSRAEHAAVWALADLATALTVRRSATESTAARMAALRR